MESKITQLKELIKKSQSINEEEKTSIISQIQDLKEEDINKMTEIFTWEQEQIVVLHKKNQETIQKLKKHSKQSLRKIKKLKKDLIVKAEKRVSEKEKAKAENLLNFDK